MSQQLAAIVAVVVLVGLTCFQLLLATGAPLGNYAWGGANRILPPRLRVASVLASLIYVLAALVILEAAGVTDFVASRELPRTIVWVLAALFAVGVVMNAISRSKKERLMALVALSLSVLCVIVGLDS
ncbi:MAG: hypothetical protein ACRDG6_04870 [Candidatus Limnocylindria bacterium]